MNLPISFIVRARFKVLISSEDGCTVRLEGALDEEGSSAWFGLVLDEIHRDAHACGLKELTLDLCNLESASSALWEGLAGWIEKLHGSSGGYMLHLLSSSERPWQESGARALSALGCKRFFTDKRAPSSGPRPRQAPIEPAESVPPPPVSGADYISDPLQPQHITAASRYGNLR